MKIYFDGIIYSWQRGGGVYRYFEEIITRAGLCGECDPVVLAHIPSYMYMISKKVGVRVMHVFPPPPASIFPLLRKALSVLNRITLGLYFSRITQGVFHSTYYTTYNSLKIPQVLTVHDMTHERFPEYFASSGAKRFIANKKKCIMNADSIICVSEATKKALTEIYKVKDKKIFVVHHGISEIFKINTASIDNKALCEPYFLFVGNRGLYKNFLFFIKTFSKWSKNKAYNIVLVGGGRLSKEELMLTRNLGLDEQIKYLGFVEEENLKYIYQASRALVFPSLDEGFGLPILEALSSKTQVLASNIESFKEIGEDMLIYFNPRKTESLISALDYCVSKDLSEIEAERRANYVIEKYTWDKCFNKTLEIYKKAVNETEN